MSYTHTLGSTYTHTLGVTGPGLHSAPKPTDMSAAAVAARNAAHAAYLTSPDAVSADICLKLGQSGALVMANGQRAVIGSPEMEACRLKAKAALEAGATREQAAAAAQQAAITGGSSKMLVYGLIGAAVLVGGAWYFSR